MLKIFHKIVLFVMSYPFVNQLMDNSNLPLNIPVRVKKKAPQLMEGLCEIDKTD